MFLQQLKLLLLRALCGCTRHVTEADSSSRVVACPQGARGVPQGHARSAHHRTRSTVPTASNKCVTPEVVIPPKMRNAHARSARIAPANVSGNMRTTSKIG